jgi:hypothetical protein
MPAAAVMMVVVVIGAVAGMAVVVVVGRRPDDAQLVTGRGGQLFCPGLITQSPVGGAPFGKLGIPWGAVNTPQTEF